MPLTGRPLINSQGLLVSHGSSANQLTNISVKDHKARALSNKKGILTILTVKIFRNVNIEKTYPISNFNIVSWTLHGAEHEQGVQADHLQH